MTVFRITDAFILSIVNDIAEKVFVRESSLLFQAFLLASLIKILFLKDDDTLYVKISVT